MKLLITGVSHKTAPVEVRECLAFREETLPAALADLKSREGVSEAVILSTCNRVEITLTTEDAADPQAIVDSFLADHKAVSAANIGPHLYRHEGRDAIHHLFRVAASLDSMVVGEPQILGQLKAAYAAAKDLRSALRLAGRPDEPLLQRGQTGALRKPASGRWRFPSATPPWNWRARFSARSTTAR